MQISLNVNNTLVQAYNNANGTNYKPLDPSLVKIAPVQCTENQVFSPNIAVVDPASIEKGYYLIPIEDRPDRRRRICRGGRSTVHYVFVTKVSMDDRRRRDGARRASKIAPDLRRGRSPAVRAPRRAAPPASGTCDSAAQKAGHVRRQARRQLLVCRGTRPIRGAETAATSPSTLGEGQRRRPASAGISTTRIVRTPSAPTSPYSEDGTDWYSLTGRRSLRCPGCSADNWKMVPVQERPSKPAISGYTSAG